MTTEGKLLLACCRRLLGSGASDIAEAADGVNWEAAIDLAEYHGVLAIVHWALIDSKENDSNAAEIPESLTARSHSLARENLAYAAQLLKILALMEREHIDVMPIKGPLLALQSFGDLGMRGFSDLDLWVSPHDVPRVIQALAGAGFTLNWTLPSNQQQAYLRVKEKQLSFLQADIGLALDLHWSLLPDFLGNKASWEEARARPQTYSLGARRVRSLSLEDLLLFLCGHGSRHLWTRLIWVCDLAGLIRSHPELNWDQVIATAERIRGRRILSVGLTMATRLLGLPLPPKVADFISGDPAVGDITREIESRILSDAAPRTALEACRVNVAMIEGFGNRARYVHGLLLQPGEAEFRAIRLPGWLYPCYYPFRMCRLFAKYITAR